MFSEIVYHVFSLFQVTMVAMGHVVKYVSVCVLVCVCGVTNTTAVKAAVLLPTTQQAPPLLLSVLPCPLTVPSLAPAQPGIPKCPRDPLH